MEPCNHWSPVHSRTERNQTLAPSWQVGPVDTHSSGLQKGLSFLIILGIMLTSLGAVAAPNSPRTMFLMQELLADLNPTPESKNSAKSECKKSAQKLSC